MKSYAFSLLVAGTCMADPSQATLEALKVPDAVDVPILEKRLTKEEFPSGLLAAMERYGWGGNKAPINGEMDLSVPEEVDFRIVDLNSDGNPEYFANTYLGGTSGPSFLLFSKLGEHWKCIGESSNFKLLPLKEGWHPIVSFGRSGSIYFKHYYEFGEGSYHHVETDEISDGKVTKTQIAQVKPGS
ncbi:MAG: hypothetical protein MUF31_08040 [Akkermansiaceae bacterium]|nr:hypothetical protein [Akkermansiaceae bacterium]